MIQVGRVLRHTMRNLVDMAGHFGDGWFGLVLPETEGVGAKTLCRRLDEAIQEKVPSINRRHFVATQWQKGEKPYGLFERAIIGLEGWSNASDGTKIHLL